MESGENDSDQHNHCNGFQETSSQIPTSTGDPIDESSFGETSQSGKVSRSQTLLPINGNVARILPINGDVASLLPINGDVARILPINGDVAGDSSEQMGHEVEGIPSLIEGEERSEGSPKVENNLETLLRENIRDNDSQSTQSQAVGGARPKVRLNVTVGEKSKSEGRTNYSSAAIASQSCDSDLLCRGLMAVTSTPRVCDKMMSFDLPNLPQMGPRSGSLRPLNSMVPGIPVLEHRTSRASSDTEDLVESEVSDICEEDCYVYTYKGGTDYLAADLPNSFFRLDSGSDGESLPGVAGAGQSNLSTGVAAFIQDQMLNARSFSPDQDEPLELDFDPGGASDSDDSEDSGQGAEGTDMEGEEPEGAAGGDDDDVFHVVDPAPIVPSTPGPRLSPLIFNTPSTRVTPVVSISPSSHVISPVVANASSSRVTTVVSMSPSSRVTPVVSMSPGSRVTPVISNTPIPRVSSPDSDGLGQVTPSPDPDASPVHGNNNNVAGEAGDASPRERSVSGDDDKSKSCTACQTCQDDSSTTSPQTQTKQSPPAEPLPPPQPLPLPPHLLPQNPPSPRPPLPLASPRPPPPLASPRPPPPLAIRSAPLMSPVESGPSLPMPRSRSLNSTLGSCLILEEGQAEPRPDIASMDAAVNLSVCGARLLQREALLFGERHEREFASALNSLRLDEEVDERRMDWVPRTMIWGERDACRRLVNQIGVSACGATALVNVLMALDVPHSLEQVQEAVRTKLRRQTSPIPDYLLSRSMAGCNHQDLMDGMQTVSGGSVVARFFPMHNRSVQLSSWLASWISRGCVPVATLNVQRATCRPGQVIADAWHHQMIWGVAGRGVYLSNPLEVVSDQLLAPQLASPSELLIRRADVVSRWSPDTDLGELATMSDEEWETYNVLGQVVNMLREDRSSKRGQLSRALTSHIRIPASYQSGITFFCLSENTQTAKKLLEAEGLPYDNSGAPSLLGYDE